MYNLIKVIHRLIKHCFFENKKAFDFERKTTLFLTSFPVVTI